MSQLSSPLRKITPAFLATITTFLVLFVLRGVPASFAQAPVWVQPPDHKPIADGDDTNGLYKGLYHGHLYGSWNHVGTDNLIGTQHDIDGLSFASQVVPLCNDGTQNCPSAQQHIVVLAIGFSNWTKEICGDQTGSYLIQPSPIPGLTTGQNHYCDPADGLPLWSLVHKVGPPNQVAWINPKVAIVDCAVISAVAEYWTSDNPAIPPGSSKDVPAHLYTNCNTNILAATGLDPRQVQVVLYKNADTGRSCGAPDNPCPNPVPLVELPTSSFNGCVNLVWGTTPDACYLMSFVGQAARTVRATYPNVKQMFVHSRIYGGYADPTNNAEALNPEPFAYEQGFAMKWLIQSQVGEINGGTGYPVPDAGSLDYRNATAPWLDWGAYMWASGTNIPCLTCGIPGLTWKQEVRGQPSCTAGQECDFEGVDNTHPSKCGRDKVSTMLLATYCTNRYMQPWLLKAGASCPAPPPTNASCDPLLR